MREATRDDAFGIEDAPPELRLPPVQRAIRVVRPVSDALARRSRDAAEVISRQGQSLGRFSAAQVKARPFATAAVALAAGAVLGVLLSPRRKFGRDVH
jgi:hypothetical protein